MDYYLYSVELPFSKVQLSYREINTKEQLILAKSNLYLPSDEEHDTDFAKALQRVIINCVENKEDFLKLTLIDYILFLTKLRIISIGNQLELEYNDQELKQKVKLTIDLSVFMRLLYETSNEVLSSSIVEDKGIKIVLGYPSIKSESLFLSVNNKTDAILSTIPEYIKQISINNKNTIDFNEFEFDQKVKIYDNLPLKIRNKIQSFVLNSIKSFSDKNLFNISRMDYFKFNLYNKAHLTLIRLMFGGELKSIYQEYYELASKNISPFYVDSMTASDRKVFCSFVNEETKTKVESQNNNSGSNGGSTELQDLIDEFE